MRDRRRRRIICHFQYAVQIADAEAAMKFGVYIGPIYPGDMDGAEAFELSLRVPQALSAPPGRARVALDANNRRVP